MRGCDGDGEVHDPDGHLQQPVRGLQPRLDHPPSYSPTSLYSPTSNTSSHVNIRSRNKLCMHDNLLHYMHLLIVPTSLSYFHLHKQNKTCVQKKKKKKKGGKKKKKKKKKKKS